ncbi:Porin [Methylorubrum thiocyanatum]
MKLSKKLSIVTVATALCVAPLSAAFADLRVGSPARPLPQTTWDGLTTGSIFPGDVLPPTVGGCRRSSAQEGNANQQNFPVQQYGQTSGGYRC